MLAIRDVRQTPVDGWGWIDPLTGFKYNADYGHGEKGLVRLLEHVRRYRADNMLTALDENEARRLIENDICKRPGMLSRCVDVTQTKRTVGQMVTGAIAAVKAISSTFVPGMHEHAMVSQRLAEKRAAICEKCPMNAPPADQSSIEQLQDKAMLKLIGSRRTSIHENLFSCAACTCNVRAKVWFAKRTIIQSLDDAVKRKLASIVHDKHGSPMVCWQLSEPP